MRVTRIRTAIWVGVLVLTLGSFASIVRFYRTDYARLPLSADRVNAIVQQGVERVRGADLGNQVLKDRSAYDTWWKFNALGIEREPEPVAAVEKPASQDHEPLATLISIAQLLVLSDPEASRALVESLRERGNVQIVGPGDALDGIDAAVVRIDVDGVVFSYGGEEVRLRPEKLFDRLAAAPGPGPGTGRGAVPGDVVGRPGEPSRGGGPGAMGPGRGIDPTKLKESQIIDGIVYVAPVDAGVLADKGEKVLEDLRLKTHSDPKTRASDGIEIGSVDSGGIAAKFGLQPGDVLKSIDGVAIHTQAALVNFVKQHQGQKVFNIVISRLGHDVPMTIRVP